MEDTHQQSLILFNEAQRFCDDGRIYECIEVLQRAIYYEPSRRATPSKLNFMIRRSLAEIYTFHGFYTQALSHLIFIFSRADLSRDKDEDLMFKVCLETARFKLAEKFMNLPIKEVVLREAKAKYSLLVEEKLQNIDFDFAKSVMEIKDGDNWIGESKIPFQPSSKRNSEEVLSFINHFLVGTKIKLRYISSEYYGLFATEEIPASTPLFTEIPFVLSGNNIEANCFHCSNPIVSRYKCCGRIDFCSQRCKNEAHQQYHSPLCGIDTTELFNIDGTSFRICILALKILGRALIENKDKEFFEKYPGKYGGLQYLYRNSLKRDSSIPNIIANLFKFIIQMLRSAKLSDKPYLSVEWFIDCCEMLLLNSIHIETDENTVEVLLRIGSFINYSTEYNCSWTLNQGNMTATSTKTIKEGEQIFTRYKKKENPLKILYDMDPQNYKKKESQRLCAESEILSKEHNFSSAVDLLLKSFYYSFDNISVCLKIVKLYCCMKSYHQAFFHMERVRHFQPTEENALLLFDLACKIGLFDDAKEILPNYDPKILQNKKDAFEITAENNFRTSPLSHRVFQLEKLGFPGIHSSFKIECIVPHIPNNKRDPAKVLKFINTLLIGTNIELRHVIGENYGLFATKDFDSEEKLLQETPYAIYCQGDHHCFHCCEKIITPVKCCADISYCSESCKNEALTQYHSPFCGDIMNFGIFSKNIFLILAWKILGKAFIQNGINTPLGKFPSRYGGLEYLFRQSLLEEHKISSIYLSTFMKISLFRTKSDIIYTPYTEFEWIIDLAETFIHNGISLDTEINSSMTFMITIISSFFRHSKYPNCSLSLKQGKLITTSKKPIKKNEQLTVYNSRENLKILQELIFLHDINPPKYRQ
jgi:hypothetical protein